MDRRESIERFKARLTEFEAGIIEHCCAAETRGPDSDWDAMVVHVDRLRQLVIEAAINIPGSHKDQDPPTM